MRNMSFALTTEQIRNRTKTVTRRMGWEFLKPGDRVGAVRKGMGLKKGERVEVLTVIVIKSVRREPLRAMTDDLEYGFAECVKEGFPPPHKYSWPSVFVNFYCRSHRGCTTDTVITRIEFDYAEES